jgi:insulysin
MKKPFLPLLLTCLLPFAIIHAESNALFEEIDDQSELTISTPALAGRRTAKLRLKNGLEAYLISDPKIEQSAAALSVNIGSWHDHKDYPGMAHFLEHMLFMGNEAYPNESEYFQYIGDNGGRVNAYTSTDRTVYMLSVNNDAFPGALNRFSHFFIDPLFKPGSIGRELLAVDQEHSKNIEHDGWRQWMIFKETGNPQHPNAGFSTGNADTLRGIPQETMKQWYRTHYSAQRMHLVVLSPLPLDQLLTLTVNDFSAVPVSKVNLPTFEETLLSKQQQGSMIYITPIKDLRQLSITWELPADLASQKEKKVGTLLAYILQNGGPTSLQGTLKKEGLAEKVRAESGSLSKTHQLFTLDIDLTDQGVAEVDQVITYCFEAIARLKETGIPRYVFDEVKNMAQIKYEYQSRKEAFEYVLSHADALIDEPLESYPQKTLVPSTYDLRFIQSYIATLTPEKAVYFVTAKPEKSGVVPTSREQWMGTDYEIRPISKEQLTAWRRAPLNPHLTLPPPNPYVPTDLTLVHNTGSNSSKVVPDLLQNNDHGKVYFATDRSYQVPEVAHRFQIKSPLIDGSATSKVLADLYLKALENRFSKTLTNAAAAGLDVEMGQMHLGLTIAINGYSQKAPELARNLFSGLKKVRISEQEFEIFKQSLSAQYLNASKELPFLQALELLGNTIFNTQPLNHEKFDALQNISYESFNHFADTLLQKNYVEALLYGNLTEPEASQLWAQIKNEIGGAPYPKVEQAKRRVLSLPTNLGPYMLVQKTPMQGNAAILLVQQGHYSFDKRAAQQVLACVLKDSFFETLRTKQQTAYIAKAWEKEEERELLQLFAVQSSTHRPLELVNRFELFLENFVKQFGTKLPPERFEQVRQMAITSLKRPAENLLLSSGRLWIMGFEQEGDFNLIEKRIEALEAITYDDVRNAAMEFFSRSNQRRLAVLMEGETPKERDFRYEVISKEQLVEQGSYVTWQAD